MIVRKVKPEEIRRTEELMSIAFDYSYDNVTLSAKELYEKYRSDPQNREEAFCLERFAAFADDDKTMMGSFIMQNFTAYFDGHKEPLYGIGGVATLPPYRRCGSIRGCFTEALPYMYEKGIAFSYLYPFSTAFYRKFGYGNCYERKIYTVSLSYLPQFAVTGSWYLVDASTKDMARKDIPIIYDAWAKQYNMMIQATDYDFRFIEKANPYKDKVYTYVYRSAAKEPLAYMTCRNLTDVRQIDCSGSSGSFFYINKEGLQGLLALAKSFASDYRELRFNLPSDKILEPVLPEWAFGAVSCHAEHCGMVRVINVKKVLQDAAYIGSGSLSLHIDDPFIPENNHTFTVTFKDGSCTGIAVDEQPAEILMPIQIFSALITGGYDADAVPQFDGVEISSSNESYRQVFYKKKVYITTAF